MTSRNETPREPAAAAPTPPGEDRDERDAGERPALLDLPAQWAKLTSDQKLRAKQVGVSFCPL